MRDIDVRNELHTRLRNTHRRELDSTRFVDELGIAGLARVDMAVLNGSFSGYEIKSERDTLSRLPNQIDVYSKVLDYCYLVTSQRHLNHASDMLPEWWGVLTAREAAGRVILTRTKTARLNRTVDPWHLSRLLWRDEVLGALEQLDLAAGVRSRPNNVLWDRLAASVSRRALRDLVREALKVRSGWRVGVTRPPGGAG